jgi:uncharacterized protein
MRVPYNTADGLGTAMEIFHTSQRAKYSWAARLRHPRLTWLNRTGQLDVQRSLVVMLISLMALVPAEAVSQNRQGEGLPFQYLYLADFARLRHEAELGKPEALFQLGLMHYDPPESSGISQSYRRAFILFFEAGLRGHTTAQHNVGAMYWNGDYVAQNLVEGYAWFRVAALAGDNAGLRKVKRHAADLSPEQLKMATDRMPVIQSLLTKANARRVYDPREYGIH